MKCTDNLSLLISWIVFFKCYSTIKFYVNHPKVLNKKVKRLKVALWGFFNTAAVRPIVFLPPTSSRIHLQRRHASYRCARLLPAKAGTITKSVIHENSLGSFTCRKAGTRDILFYFPSEGRHTEDFPDARKNPTASAGFEHANSGSSGQYANH